MNGYEVNSQKTLVWNESRQGLYTDWEITIFILQFNVTFTYYGFPVDAS